MKRGMGWQQRCLFSDPITLCQIDNYGGPELAEIIKKYNIRSPESGNELSEPQEFNLMFESSIGPTGHLRG